MKKYIILLILICTTVTVAFSQTENTTKSIYSFVPQYLINRGIRVDVEKKISGRHYIQICPQFYLSEKEDKEFLIDKNQFDYLIGGGLNIYHKIFTVDDFKYNGLYLSYGLIYNYFNIEYLDNSGEYEFSATADIHKTGADLILGYQVLLNDIVSLDFYAGLGTRLSYMNTSGNDKDRFNNGYYGYNYTGNILVLGFRIGVVL